MKKTISLLLMLAFAGSVLVGCSGGNSDDVAKPNKPPANDQEMPKNQQKPLAPATD